MRLPVPILNDLITLLSKLPGIGERTATRLALHLLKTDASYLARLSETFAALKQKVQFCSTCFGFTDCDPCRICSDPRRNPQMICVLALPQDILWIEKTLAFHGHYHILHGLITPLYGITPDKLKISQLLHRIETNPVQEVIMTLNSSVEGEATGLYLSHHLKPMGIKVSKLAAGIPIGSTLEYVDELTIRKALESRQALI